MEYRQFRVIVQGGNEVTGYTHNGPAIKGNMQMDNLRVLTIGIFSKWLAADKANQRDEFKALGSHLYEALFGSADSKIRRAFEEEFNKSQKQRPFTPLRLVLEFTRDADKLAILPWEYLYYPEPGTRGFFIAAHTEVIMVRHSTGDIDQDMLKQDKGPLRILMVVSKPEYEEVQGEDEEPEERKKLNVIVDEPVITTITGINSIKTSILTQPTKRSLPEKIAEFKPHVVHFIGHGRYKERGELALVSDENSRLADWIDDASFADCFMRHRPGLVFLHACEGGYSESYESFKGLALQLIDSKIPAVVAMQYEVRNDVANHFAAVFYQSLSEGRAIDDAVQRGRIDLGTNSKDWPNYSNRAFGCPVIYMQKSNTEMVLIEAQEPQGRRGTQPLTTTPTTKQSRCPRCGVPVRYRLPRCYNCTLLLRECPQCDSMMAKGGACSECDYNESPGAVLLNIQATAPSVSIRGGGRGSELSTPLNIQATTTTPSVSPRGGE